MPESVTQYNGLSGRLKTVRQSLGKSQREMDEFLGLGKKAWQNYESQGTEPGSAVIAKLVEKGINANWLLTGEGRMLVTEPTLAERVDVITRFQEYREGCCDGEMRMEAALAAFVADYNSEPPRIQRVKGVERITQSEVYRWMQPQIELKSALQGDQQAAAQVEARRASVLQQVREMSLMLKQLEDEVGYKPPLHWHEMLKTLLHAHGLDQAGAARILELLKREREQQD